MKPACELGHHTVPDHIAFSHYGAVFQGGLCVDCGQLCQGEFLKNVWTDKQIADNDIIMLSGYDVSDLQEDGYVVLSLHAMQRAWALGEIQESGYPSPPDR